MRLTLRDVCIIEALTRHVRMASFAQASGLWWPVSSRSGAARRRLSELVGAGWLERFVVNAHPPLPVGKPLFAWSPGGEEPDAERVSRQCRARWSRAAVPTEVFVASPRAASLLASTARGIPPQEHRDHDLRLASVYVHYHRSAPDLAAKWIGEHVLPKAGYRIKDPDAFLRDDRGRILRVIESAGRYGPKQVESFHDHCRELDLPYELW
jgi:hypothetical protein